MMMSIKNVLPASVGYMLLSALGFALMAACVKVVATQGIPIFEIVAARAIVSGLISYADIKRKKISPWGNNKPLLVLRGLMGAVALMFVYYSVTHLPLAEATILQYLHPLFTAILAVLFLKEVIKRSTLACIVLCLIGLVVMLVPNLQSSATDLPYSWFSISAALLGALGSAVAYVMVKQLTKTDDSSVIVFYFPFIALPVSLLLLGDGFVVPSLTAMGLLVLVGIFTQVGQVGLTKALACDDASKATAYAYVQVVFSIMIGWLYFSEVPTLTTVIGGSLIIAGALINVLWKR